MKNCDRCGRAPNLCCCLRVELEHCGLCSWKSSRHSFNWIGNPNPFGVWRGEVFSHFECKDKKACAERSDKTAVVAG